MSIPFVDLEAQYQSIQADIDGAIQRVLSNKHFIGGEEVKKFEDAFGQATELPYVIGCANGTDALEMAVEALGIGVGDEVIVPSLTWISTAEAVSRAGARPVFVDTDPNTYTLDVHRVEALITAKTKAIIPVHFYGLPAPMPEIMKIASAHNLRVIEDAAQAQLASIDGKQVGQFGDIVTFSFYPGKNLGAYGDAGAVATKDEALARRLRQLGNHGQLVKHQHEILGRNSRLDALQAAILSAKLPHLPKWTVRRQEVAAYYDQHLTDAVQKPSIPEGFEHVFHLYVIQSDRRADLLSALKRNEIGCSIHYPHALPMVSAYESLNQGSEAQVAQGVCDRILSLPMYPEMTTEQQDQVIGVVNQLLGS